jgi:hypothetical protein
MSEHCYHINFDGKYRYCWKEVFGSIWLSKRSMVPKCNYPNKNRIQWVQLLQNCIQVVAVVFSPLLISELYLFGYSMVPKCNYPNKNRIQWVQLLQNFIQVVAVVFYPLLISELYLFGYNSDTKICWHDSKNLLLTQICIWVVFKLYLSCIWANFR